MNIFIENCRYNFKIKWRRENTIQFHKKILSEWQDLKEYRLDINSVIILKVRQISNLEYELKEKLYQQNP